MLATISNPPGSSGSVQKGLPPTRPPAAASGSGFDLDLLGFRLRDGRLRHRDGQHPFRHAGFDVLRLDALGQLQRSGERSVAALYNMSLFVLLFLLGLLLAADGQDIVDELDLHVLLLEAWQL